MERDRARRLSAGGGAERESKEWPHVTRSRSRGLGGKENPKGETQRNQTEMSPFRGGGWGLGRMASLGSRRHAPQP